MYRGLARHHLSNPVGFLTKLFVLSLLVLHHQAWAADPTQGCDSCPSDTVCIKDMCYTVVAAPPGLDEPCVEAYCAVEKGGTCVNGECVVPVAESPESDTASPITPNSVDDATPSTVTPSAPSAPSASSASSVVGLTSMAGLLCVLLAMYL